MIFATNKLIFGLNWPEIKFGTPKKQSIIWVLLQDYMIVPENHEQINISNEILQNCCISAFKKTVLCMYNFFI